MTPARWPRPDPLEERLLLVDRAAGAFADAHVGDLAELLRAGDLLVVNDAATLPASLAGQSPSGRPIEVRLAGERADGSWWAVLFGEGDWRTSTEERRAPEPLRPGDRIVFEMVSSQGPAAADARAHGSGQPRGGSSTENGSEAGEISVGVRETPGTARFSDSVALTQLPNRRPKESDLTGRRERAGTGEAASTPGTAPQGTSTGVGRCARDDSPNEGAARGDAPERKDAATKIAIEDERYPLDVRKRAEQGRGPTLTARVQSVSGISPRLVALRFDFEGASFWSALYAIGRPVQYSYLLGPLDLWHVQTRYGSRPRAVEMPSAGRPLTWSLLGGLARRGIRIAYLTHAAGLSSTGDADLDAALPLPERFEIPEATIAAIADARRAGGRVVAVGTTVVRALEGCAARNGGHLLPGEGVTDLVIGHGFRPRVVDGLLTGLHEPAASHFALVQAFAPGALVREAYAHAEREEYRHHEFGDSCLLLPGILGAVRGSRPMGAEMAIRG